MLNITEYIKYEKFNIQNNTYHLAVYDIKENDNYKDTILLLHGIDGLAKDFSYLANDLVKHNYRVILLDMFGRGKSSFLKNRELYINDFYTKILIEISDRIGLQNINICSTSMGALLTISLCSHKNNIAKRIILNDIGPYVDPTRQLKLAQFFNNIPSFTNYAEACNFLKNIYGLTGIETKEQWLYFFKSRITYVNNSYRLHSDPNIFITFLENAKTMVPIDIWYHWDNISPNTKILCLRGELSPLFNKSTLNRMLENNNCQSYTFKNIAHAPMLFNKEQKDVIISWLENDNFIETS